MRQQKVFEILNGAKGAFDDLNKVASSKSLGEMWRVETTGRETVDGGFASLHVVFLYGEILARIGIVSFNVPQDEHDAWRRSLSASTTHIDWTLDLLVKHSVNKTELLTEICRRSRAEAQRSFLERVGLTEHREMG